MSVRLPLRFRDVDAFGHVYHAEHLTLLDEARSRWLGDVLRLEDPGSYVVARIEVDYLSPLQLSDREVLADLTLERVGTTSLTLAETLSAPDGRPVSRARTVVVRWDVPGRRPRALTDDERSRATDLVQPLA